MHSVTDILVNFVEQSMSQGDWYGMLGPCIKTIYEVSSPSVGHCNENLCSQYFVVVHKTSNIKKKSWYIK